MNVLFLSDNREEYRQGYYYEDWLQAFKKRFPNIVVFGPGYSTKKDEIPHNIDLIIYGHSFIENFYLRPVFFSKRNFNGLTSENIKRFAKIPSIMFSKNEYKLVDERLDFLKGLEDCLLVVYSRQSLLNIRDRYNNIIWIPFGINTDRFYQTTSKRDMDLGMRGNRHGSYIGGLRAELADRAIEELSYLKLDIKLSNNGEDFLFGKAYFDWLNSLKMVLNTKSAMDIVNPKFAETIACGAITACPVDEYEGLLVKDQHYLNIEDIIKLKSRDEFLSFYEDRYESMHKYRLEYIKNYDYNNLLDIVIKKLNREINCDNATEYLL